MLGVNKSKRTGGCITLGLQRSCITFRRLCSPMAVVWAWHGDGGLVPYDDRVSERLEAGYQHHGEQAVIMFMIGGVGYSVSHEKARGWVQRRALATHRSRPVVRCAPSSAAGSGSQAFLSTPSAAGGSEVFVAESSSTADLASALGWGVVQAGDWVPGALDPIMMTELGEAGEQVVRLPCDSPAIPCTFNRSTVEAAFASSSKCPSCGQPYPLPGPQPSGVMKWRINLSCDCDGHPGCGTIEVRYEFSSGVQGRQHPSPGQPYIGTQRDALLPNDGTGQQALALLRRAFRQGKCFAVGSSATTGRSDVVVWRIHQKTSRKGGPTQHGWPDATYLDRLKSECAAAAVAEEGS